MTPVSEGLSKELRATLKIGCNPNVSKRQIGLLDCLGGGIFGPLGYSSVFGWSVEGYIKYLAGRLFG